VSETGAPAAEDGPSRAATALADFEAGKLLRRSIVGLLLLMAALAGISYMFKDQVIAGSTAFVAVAGGPGVMAAWFLLDLLPVPIIPHDVFSTLAYLGNLGFWTTVAWSSAGSILGGCASWALSSRLAHRPMVHRAITTGRARKMFELTRKYGALALAVGAVSPLPYSIAAWACGATDLRFGPFVAVSLLRIPRIAFYLYLVKLGTLNVLA
jgi:membrane protein YqaA with SNARE-associated domain